MESLDIRIAKRMQRWSGGATAFWRFFARYAMYGFVVAVFMFGTVMPLEDALTALFIPAFFAFLATSCVQYIVRRPRPTVTKTDFHQWMLHYSFPSAHASAASCFVVLLSDAALRVVPDVAGIFIPCAIVLALGVAISRVIVGVHHPSDVVAGAVFGSAIGLLFVTI